MTSKYQFLKYQKMIFGPTNSILVKNSIEVMQRLLVVSVFRTYLETDKFLAKLIDDWNQQLFYGYSSGIIRWPLTSWEY